MHLNQNRHFFIFHFLFVPGVVVIHGLVMKHVYYFCFRYFLIDQKQQQHQKIALIWTFLELLTFSKCSC
jgi:hypothetical protein